ncbi:uncharacterized protein [Primulina eburnea]|uniref:uncharacterized protein n=1 Tax=Primulina eburnea TaxID=1245227 RepID=UPI003C6C2306
MKTKESQENRFLRIITIPVRALAKVRDLYVKSMTRYADKISYSNVIMGLPQVSGLPKSFSVNSAGSLHDEDFRELVRAASARSIPSRVDMDMYIKAEMMKIIHEAGSGNGPRAMPPRSRVELMKTSLVASLVFKFGSVHPACTGNERSGSLHMNDLDPPPCKK